MTPAECGINATLGGGSWDVRYVVLKKMVSEPDT